MKREDFVKMTLPEMLDLGTFTCPVCGREHIAGTRRVIVEKGAVRRLPEVLKEIGAKKPFILSGAATFAAAGEKVCKTLDEAGIPYSKYVYPNSPVIPDERSLGSAFMHFDYSCDVILGVGSGVINDLGKLLAKGTGHKHLIFGTAPSMDGYCSGTSSMERDGLKTTIDSSYAYAVIGDLDVLCKAPMHMMASGVGDMVAKFISLTEWDISRIINDEYFCPLIYDVIKSSISHIVSSIDKYVERDPEAVKNVMEGLALSGIGMNYAKVSRPASGMEHYFSHVWDMRALAFPEAKNDLHGIQCGIGTLYALKVYDYLKTITPDRAKAMAYADNFSQEDWNNKLRTFIGHGAEAMIANEKKEQRYNLANHEKRIDSIIRNWDAIVAEMNKLPSYDEIYGIITKMGAPTDPFYLGYDIEQVKTTFTMSKDIREKYVGSLLCWDMGVMEEAAEVL